MRLSSLILLAALAGPASADSYSSLYGVWGTAKQCARAPIKAGGSVLATPVEIGREWLTQGGITCRLKWFPIEQRANELFTGAHAQCGEDSVRDYFLRMTLAQDELTLRWGVFQSSEPLARCTGS